MNPTNIISSLLLGVLLPWSVSFGQSASLSNPSSPLTSTDKGAQKSLPSPKAEKSALSLSEALEKIDLSTPEKRRISAEQVRQAQMAEKAAGEALAQKMGWKLRAPIVGISPAGIPAIQIDHNANAAISSGLTPARARQEYASLTGASMLVGCWEVYDLSTTHQEYASRLTMKEESPDLDIKGHHATHVVGTLVGSGSVAAAAKGMAPAASVWFWTAAYDLAEMTAAGANLSSEAINNSHLILSNHSYGIPMGWHYDDANKKWFYLGPANTTEDPAFGYYNAQAKAVDTLSREAPYYLIVQAAGNERNSGPPPVNTAFYWPALHNQPLSYDPVIHPLGDGQHDGYDTLPYDKTYKNGLVVGAVNDAVSNGNRSASAAVLASFSSCGPTDDGRIKPDLVGNGVSLLSAWPTSDTATDSISGTSMASPNVCGSALIVQQYYKNQFSDLLLNYELKTLLLHTATDLGNLGPDYRFGWGLVNVEAALDRLRDRKNNPTAPVMKTSFLAQDWKDSYVTTFISNGSQIKITLCWNDPAATPLASNTLNDRTRMLINDLDLRLENPNGQTMELPWRCDPANPANPATRGDNNVDNVEQIITNQALLPGTYTVRVSHKGTLSAPQSFCLVISGQQLVTSSNPLLTASMGDGEFYSPPGQIGQPGTLYVANTGSGTLNYTVSSSQSWLVPSVSNGASTGETDTIALTPALQNLSEGTHTATVTVQQTGIASPQSRSFVVKYLVGQTLSLDAAIRSWPETLDWTAGGSLEAPLASNALGFGTYCRFGKIVGSGTSWLRAPVLAPSTVTFEREIFGAGSILEVLLDGNLVRSVTGPSSYGSEVILVSGSGTRTMEIRLRRAAGIASDLGDGLIIRNFEYFFPVQIDPIPPIVSEYDTGQGELTYRGYVESWSVSAPGVGANNVKIVGLSINENTGLKRMRIELFDLNPGNYTLTITANGVGGVDSETVSLTVLSTGFSGPDNARCNAEIFQGPRWFTVASPSHDGVDAAQSAAITHNSVTEFQASFLGPGVVRFWWKVSSEATYDKLTLLKNFDNNVYTEVASISGEQDWAQYSISLSDSGFYQYLKWRYSKDGSVNAGQDKAWVDQVEYFPAPVLESLTPATAFGQVGKQFDYYLALDRGQVTSATVDALPPGLSFVNLRVVGTPTTVGETNSTFTLTGPGGTLVKNVRFRMSPAGLTLERALQSPEEVRIYSPSAKPWYGTEAGIRSPVLGNGEQSQVNLEVTGPCLLRFRYSLSSDAGEQLTVSVDGAPATTLSQPVGFESSWGQAFKDFSSHQIIVKYIKDGSSRTGGQDRAQLSRVERTPLGYYGGPGVHHAFQGQFFRNALTIYNDPGYSFFLTPILPSGVNLNKIEGTPRKYFLTGTPTAAGSSVIDASVITDPSSVAGQSMPGQYTLTVHPTVNLPGSVEWGATLLLPMTTGGDQPWFGQDLEKQDGVDAAKAGTVLDNGRSWLQTSLPSDALFKWRWKANCELQWDYLMLEIDGQTVASISGSTNWTQQSVKVGPGSHTARFTYVKDGTVSFGQDTAWLDTLEYFQPPKLIGPTSLMGTVGTALTPTGMGGIWLNAASYAALGLPPGVTINATTGQISGTPTSAGTFSATISAATEAGTHSLGVTVTINAIGTAAAATDFSGPWLNTPGQPAWFGQSMITHDGVDALQSGYLTDARVENDVLIPQRSTTSLDLTGPGTLSLWHKVESEANFDFFIVEIDGMPTIKRSGNLAWRQDTLELQPGPHRVEFIYEKDASIGVGRDAAWIDQLVWTPGPVPPAIRISNVRFSGNNALIDFPSKSGRTYTIVHSNDLLNWLPIPLNGTLNGNGNTMSFVHLNARALGTRFYYRITETRP